MQGLLSKPGDPGTIAMEWVASLLGVIADLDGRAQFGSHTTHGNALRHAKEAYPGVVEFLSTALVIGYCSILVNSR